MNKNQQRSIIRERRKKWIQFLESDSKHWLVERSVNNSTLYDNYKTRNDMKCIKFYKKPYHEPAIIEYREEKTNETIMNICQEITQYDVSPKEKVAVLNFASYKKPGGGFFTGTGTAQEESLCEVSNLGLILKSFEDEYHERKSNQGLYSNDTIYSPDVLFKDTDKKDIFRYCDIITISAPNYNVFYKFQEEDSNNPYSVFQKYDLYLSALKDRIHTIFDIAVDNNVDTLVLGAFGCGVFGNQPSDVARYMAKYVKKYRCFFKKIIFTIPENKKVTPYFKSELSKLDNYIEIRKDKKL